MRFKPTGLEGAWVIEPDRHTDERGSFARAFCAEEFGRRGLPASFPQSSISHNICAYTLRGLHLNINSQPEAKVVRCVRGAIHDVIVDVRPGSPTFGDWHGIDLSADNGYSVLIPAGFGHGFLTLTDSSDVFYMMDAPYVAEAARGFRWNDPQFGVEWPAQPAQIATRDATYPDFDPSLLTP